MTMTTIEVFDRPMCCSSGVCGPDPDAQLARFAADLDWLRRQGVEVRRYNLAKEPEVFAGNVDVKRVIDETDGDGLPVFVVDGEVMEHGSYPGRAVLARWVGLPDSDQAEEATEDSNSSLVTSAVAELIAIGAAIASNCEPCFKYHHRQASTLGVSKDDMIEAVNIALRVKEAPAEAIVRLARKYLVPEDVAAAGGCCSGGGDTQGTVLSQAECPTPSNDRG
jgi:AhpD family alkylhydroperoxidase